MEYTNDYVSSIEMLDTDWLSGCDHVLTIIRKQKLFAKKQ